MWNSKCDLLPAGAADGGVGGGGLARDPFGEAGEVRVGGEFFGGVEIAGELRLGEERVDLLVAGAAERDGFFAGGFREGFADARAGVELARHEVVPGQRGDGAAAEGAGFAQ